MSGKDASSWCTPALVEKGLTDTALTDSVSICCVVQNNEKRGEEVEKNEVRERKD